MQTLSERTLFVVIVFGLTAGLCCTKSGEKRRPAAGPQASMGSVSPPIQPNVQPAIAPAAESGRSRPAGKIDSCTLLSPAEIQAIQSEPLKETKSSARAEGGFEVSQCFFTLATFTNSISLVVMQRGDGPDARDPKEFWKEKFRDRKEDSKESERERAKDRDKQSENDHAKVRDQGRSEEAEESAKARKISHLGDEAFWSGNPVGGALYVLKGNAFLRISVGGSGEQRAQIKRTQALAQRILKRLNLAS